MEASSGPWDRIRIRQWTVLTAIGVYEHELSTRQPLVLDLTLEGDFRRAGETDDLEHALDYAVLKSSLEEWVSVRRWQLIEAFAEQLCQKVLELPMVLSVHLTVEKPQALYPALVSFELTRRQGSRSLV